MEIELKLRLASAADHAAVLALFRGLASARFVGTEFQQNNFLDGPDRAFEKARRTFRLRQTSRFDAATNTTNPKSTITLKGKGVIKDGVSVIEELEEPIEEDLINMLLEHPTHLPELASRNRLLQVVLDDHPEARQLQVTGSFKNERNIFSWNDLKIEIDQTSYSFGTGYEIEVETDNPQRAKDLLIPLLTANSIPFVHSQRSKFANMKLGSIL